MAKVFGATSCMLSLCANQRVWIRNALGFAPGAFEWRWYVVSVHDATYGYQRQIDVVCFTYFYNQSTAHCASQGPSVDGPLTGSGSAVSCC